MSQDLVARAAKLLRMLTSSHDGEVLAAANRLNALVISHGVDWDAALGGNDGPTLSQEQMQRLYDEGYNRGFVDGQQQAKPARDWTPTGGTSAEVGSDYVRLKLILAAAKEADEADLLNDFEIEFYTSMRGRLSRYGQSTFVSEKQWAVLDRLHQKLDRYGFISS
jgi:hypothetical protein